MVRSITSPPTSFSRLNICDGEISWSMRISSADVSSRSSRSSSRLPVPKYAVLSKPARFCVNVATASKPSVLASWRSSASEASNSRSFTLESCTAATMARFVMVSIIDATEAPHAEKHHQYFRRQARAASAAVRADRRRGVALRGASGNDFAEARGEEDGVQPNGRCSGEVCESRVEMIAPNLGAKKLGYNLTAVPPGKRAYPFHSHRAREEMFFI